MPSGLPLLSSYRPNAARRSRAVAFALALALTLLLGITLYEMGLIDLGPGRVPARMVAIDVRTAPSGGKTPTKTPKAQERAKVHPVEQPPMPKTVPAFTHLSHADFASWDISKLPSHAAESSDAASGGSSYGPGDGPGGAHLFNAEWYREPSGAELSGYMTPGANEGGNWAIIACKTLPDYHVEDCQELDETPGSGLARALRRAAWQFLVRPPRLGGKPIIGAWVRIRFDFRRAHKSDTPPGGDAGDPMPQQQ